MFRFIHFIYSMGALEDLIFGSSVAGMQNLNFQLLKKVRLPHRVNNITFNNFYIILRRAVTSVASTS